METNKKNSARKKYLFFFSLKKEEQEIVDRDLNSPEFTDFCNDTGKDLFIPEKYSAENTFEIIEEHISDSMIGKMKRKNQYLGIAASIAILFVLSFLFIKQQIIEKDVQIILASTGHGERLEVRLPDSSTVILNSLSSLSYPDKFSKDKREVTLTGEGEFHVTKDKTRPFKITVGEIDVRVLGTVFNIKAYENDNFIETRLIEGSIAIDCNGESRMMEPGEMAYYNKEDKSLRINQVPHSPDISWKNYQFIFDNLRLEEICKQLEREKDIKIIIEDEPLKHFKITAKFIHRETPLEMLDILGNSGNFKCQRKGKNYYINSNTEK